VYPRRRHDQDPDGNWSSSEDDVGNGYEMQHGYAMAQNPTAARGYSPPFDTNTAYQSQTHAVSGDAMHAPQETSRGRQLTDTPLRDV
jgi:hypothetical protein